MRVVPVRRPLTPAVLALCALALAACGGDADPSAGATPTPSASPVPTAVDTGPGEPSPTGAAPADVAGQPFSADGCSIVFPEGWEVREFAAGTRVVAASPDTSGDFRVNMNLVIEDTGDPGLTLQQYVTATRSSLPRLLPGVEVLDSRVEGDLGELRYRGPVGGRTLDFAATVGLRDGRACIATLTTPVDALPGALEQVGANLASVRAV